ncbi:MAG: histidine kinase dimerization/phospho-acceptor domain-containing protein [Terriglobia bacterium]
MLRVFWRWPRQRLLQLALKYPPLMAGLIFLFFLTVSNQVYFTTGIALQLPAFWHMLLMGTLMATYGAFLLHEIIRMHSKLARVQVVRTLVSTLQHEMNTPLMVIQLSAHKLQTLKSYDETCVNNILDHTLRIRDLIVKLSHLDQEVRLHQKPGFEGLIDVTRSR